MPASKKTHKTPYNYIACTFQGGGALGAYQVGVLRALTEAGYSPDWFVGTSIGAINAAIAAGNPIKTRIEKMYAFWESIATHQALPSFDLPETLTNQKMAHLLSAHASLFFGQPGFFTPRFPYPELGWHDSADMISYYDTAPLRETLERFVDFDLINSKATRLSVGAVEVSSGQMIYFDSQKERIGPEHIMASGALPPGFPAVEVNGLLYWDGGISNNTPISYVLGHQEQNHLLCFMVNLFNSYGLDPKNLDEVIQRKKDIEFSSKYNKTIELYKLAHELKSSIHVLSKLVPKELHNNPEFKLCRSRGHQSTVSLVHFLYEKDNSELSSKDYEFSQSSIKKRIAKGYHDGKKAIKESPWQQPVSVTEGIALHEMSSIKNYNKDKHHEGSTR